MNDRHFEKLDEMERQLAAAAAMEVRFKREAVPIRNSFISSNDGLGPAPLAQLVQSGRGWDARLRTYLTVLWGAIPPSYSVALGASAYAQIAGIPSSRQVRAAVTALVKLSLLEVVESGAGKPLVLRPLHESGSGASYTAPYEGTSDRGRRGFDNLYIRLPVAFWTRGWIATLSGPAIATLLIYEQMRASQGRAANGAVWLSLELAQRRFGVSEDTRYRGLRELRDAGLATVETRGHAKPPYKTTNRQFVTLHLEELRRRPELSPVED